MCGIWLLGLGTDAAGFDPAGLVMGAVERARHAYERAVFGGDPGGLAEAELGLDRVEAELVLARGRLVHARFLEGQHRVEEPELELELELGLFERAVGLYRGLGDVRGEAEGLFWVGVWHQVVRGDQDSARPVFERARGLAERAGDGLTLSYVPRHLGIGEHVAGRLAEGRELLEESVRLRREIGFMAGVAANLVGLAYIALAEGRRDEAVAALDEAAAIAEEDGAGGVMRSIQEARTRL